jgi:hypothetical protein
VTAPADRVFDRHPSPPSKSRLYSVRQAGVPRTTETAELRETHWQLTPDFPLDQGSEGACVGFGLAAELSADPIMLPTGAPFAQHLYELAREQDRQMGLVIPSGATVLGGLRAATAIGQIQGFAWAQSSQQLLDAVLRHGSVVVGTDWRSGMDRLTPEFVARVTGGIRGGHCWAIVGYIPRFPMRDWSGRVRYYQAYEAINSWGPDYGRNGRFYVLRQEADRLIFAQGGEAAIVTDTPVTPAAA